METKSAELESKSSLLKIKDCRIKELEAQLKAKDDELKQQLKAKDDELKRQLEAKDDELKQHLEEVTSCMFIYSVYQCLYVG